MNTSETDPLNDIRAAKVAAERLVNTERSLRAQHTALVDEWDKVFGALRSREEIQATAAQLVDDRHAQYVRDHGFSWTRQLSGSCEVAVEGLGSKRERVYERKTPPRMPEVSGLYTTPGALSFTDLCGISPEAVKATLQEMIASQPVDQFGLPPAARTTKLAELAAQIAEIEARHRQWISGASSCGIDLPALTKTGYVHELRKKEADAVPSAS